MSTWFFVAFLGIYTPIGVDRFDTLGECRAAGRAIELSKRWKPSAHWECINPETQEVVESQGRADQSSD